MGGEEGTIPNLGITGIVPSRGVTKVTLRGTKGRDVTRCRDGFFLGKSGFFWGDFPGVSG